MITETREATPIEVFKITKTNNAGIMSKDAQAAYVSKMFRFSCSIITYCFLHMTNKYSYPMAG